MKFILEIDKEKIISILEESLKRFIFFIYSWLTTDGEVLGYILGVGHFIVAITIFIILIISYTIYPAFWLQLVVVIGLFIIWIQHIVLRVCISIVAEQNLTNHTAPFFIIVDGLTEYIGIKFNTFVEHVVIAETIAIACLSLGLIGRMSIAIHDKYGIPY
jgi:hypothetical protein